MNKPLHVRIVSIEEDLKDIDPMVREEMVKTLHRINYLFEGDVEFNKKVMLRACQLVVKKYGYVPKAWMEAVQKVLGY